MAATDENLPKLAQRYHPIVHGWITYDGKDWDRNFSDRLGRPERPQKAKSPRPAGKPPSLESQRPLARTTAVIF